MDAKAQKKLFDALRAVDTPTICNALEEARGVRTATGFTTQHLHPTEPDAPPMVGYARTGIIRAAQPAVGSRREEEMPSAGIVFGSGEGPTVATIQDLDSLPHRPCGARSQPVHRGLVILGCVTNARARPRHAGQGPRSWPQGRPQHASSHSMAGDAGRHFRHDRVHCDLSCRPHGAVSSAERRQAWAAIDLLARKEKVILNAAKKKGFGIEVLRKAFAASEDIH